AGPMPTIVPGVVPGVGVGSEVGCLLVVWVVRTRAGRVDADDGWTELTATGRSGVPPAEGDVPSSRYAPSAASTTTTAAVLNSSREARRWRTGAGRAGDTGTGSERTAA